MSDDLEGRGRPAYVFNPVLPGQAMGEPDDIDEAAIEAVADTVEVVGLWRTWRSGEGEPLQRLYLAEVDADAESRQVAAEVHDRLIAAGEELALVETYRTGEELSSYHRQARSAGELLWMARDEVDIRVATLHSVVDPPSFTEAEQLPDDEDGDAERTMIEEYLRAGTLLMATTLRTADVVNPHFGSVVPMNVFTDGTWIWSEAVEYYVSTYGYLADPEFRDYLAYRDYVVETPTGVDMFLASAHLRRRTG